MCRECDLKQFEVEEWMDTFLKSGERGLKARTGDKADARDREAREFRAKVGEFVLELDARTELQPLNDRDQPSDRSGTVREERQRGVDRSAVPAVWRPRSSAYDQQQARPVLPCNPDLVRLMRQIVDANPRYGLRRIVAVARRKSTEAESRKAIHRIVKENGWQLRQMPRGKRPCAAGWRLVAEKPNQRWAVDVAHVFCGRDGCHPTAIIDCCDRAIVRWRLSKTGVAKVAAAALEDALRERSVGQEGSGLVLRSDNGLVFGARPFVAVVNRWKLEQEYIFPQAPEQNGMIERFFGSLRSERVWLRRFESRDQAFRVIADWIEHCHDERPHQALDYLTLRE